MSRKRRRKPTPKQAIKPATAPVETPSPGAAIESDQELARHYGVSAKTIYTWRESGMPAEAVGRGYRYRLEQTDPWVEAFRKRSDDDASPATRVRLIKEKWKAKQERLKARALQREDEIAEGNILHREEWELFSIELIQQTRDRFMRVPKLLCKHIPQKFHKVMQTEGAAEVRKICEEMARTLAEGVKE